MITNKLLLQHILESKLAGKPTKELSNDLMCLTEKYTQKFLHSAIYLDDLKITILSSLMTYWNRFDESKSDNPFAYFSAVMSSVVSRYQQKLKRSIDDPKYREDIGLWKQWQKDYKYIYILPTRKEPVSKWANENMSGKWHTEELYFNHKYTTLFMVRKKKDAVLAKLVWV
jgi:hypothetical protein